MKQAEGRWSVELTASAEADFRQIVRWTKTNFGAVQARTYASTLSAALRALEAGPTIIGVKHRSEIAPNILSLHVAREGRKGRHLVLFRPKHIDGAEVIEVLRVLHDSMDFARHLPNPPPE